MECHEVILIAVAVCHLDCCLGELNVIRDLKDGVTGMDSGDEQT